MQEQHFVRLLSPSFPARLRRAGAIGGICAAGVIMLAGCVNGTPGAANSAPSSGPSTSSGPSASPSVTSSASASPSVSPSPSGTPFTVACTALIPAQTVYDFNPNFGLDSIFTPKSGTPAATAIASKGTACNWTNQTSSDTFTASVAAPSKTSLAAIRATASSGTAVADYGDAAYFSTSNSVGRIDVFKGGHWLSLTSVYFASARDASALLQAAVGSL